VRAAWIAREAGIPVVADFEGGDSALLRELMALVDHLIVPSGFAQALAGETDPQAAVAKLCALREG